MVRNIHSIYADTSNPVVPDNSNNINNIHLINNQGTNITLSSVTSSNASAEYEKENLELFKKAVRFGEPGYVPLPNWFKGTAEQAYHMEQVLRGNATEIYKSL